MSAHVVTGTLHRVQRGKGKGFAGAPPSPRPEEPARPPRAAIMLAIAWKIQRAIDRGEVKDRAEVARRLGMTRARITQLLNLALLAPDIQAEILTRSGGAATERGVRRVALSPCRDEQRVTWTGLAGNRAAST